MRCSVIILNWNGAQMLQRFLPSVIRYSLLPDCEVVVADNGSTDNSIDLLQTIPEVRTLRFTENYGFAEGYNKALAATDAEYTVLLNSDVEVTEGWLNSLLDYMDAHPDTAACQPKILSYKSKNDYENGKSNAILFEHAGAAGGYIDSLGYPYCRGRMMNHAEPDNGQYDTVANVFWASGACLCIRTDVYKKEGGLDALFFAHMEEIDLCWRLQCRGYRVACVPQSKVYHVGGGSLDYENPRKIYLNFRNNLLMLYKNLPANRLYITLFVRFAMDYLALLQYLLCGKTANAKAVWQARKDFHFMRRTYRLVRNENLRKASVPYPTTIAHRSIVWDYYIRKMRQ